MAKLPDKFSLGARPVPQGGRGVVGISMDSPVAAAGERLGKAVAGFGAALERRAAADERLKVAEATSAFLQRKIGIEREFDGDAEHDTAVARFQTRIEQARAESIAELSPRQLAQFDARMKPLALLGYARVQEKAAERRRQAEETALTGAVETTLETMKGAELSDQTVGLLNIRTQLDAAVTKGTITAERAKAISADFAQRLDVENFDRLPPDQRLARLQALEAGKGGVGPGVTFDAALRAKKRDEAAADRERQESQARSKAERERAEGAARSMLDRYGSSPVGERQARAALEAQFGGNAVRAERLYDGLLQARRGQERRGEAQAAVNTYGLALAGREDEIAAADRKRLHDAGQLDAILEAAQLSRAAPQPGELLFRERWLAMTPQQRAGYGLGELAKRLSPQDFADVAKITAEGNENEAERARMEGFAQQVRRMLPSVALGGGAGDHERERDRSLLAAIRDEVGAQVADEEKKKGRKLTAAEYQPVMRQAANSAFLRFERLRYERQAAAFMEGMSMFPEVA